jgi:hypothetical protein
LRSAPIIVDLRHLFTVFKFAVDIWEKGEVSFEFCACLYLLLQRFSEHRRSSHDENEYDMILDMLVNLHSSANFENLMCFDPSLRWIFSCFPRDQIRKIFDSSLPTLPNNHAGDFVIIVKCLALGVGDCSVFEKAVKKALVTVGAWAHPIQKEARTSLATLPLSAPKAVTPAVIDQIAAFLKQTGSSEPPLYIFAQFLVTYFLGSSVPLHGPLLKGLLSMLPMGEGKRTLPIDIQDIVIAVCSNPVRFLLVLKDVGEKRALLFTLLKQSEIWENSLMSALVSPQKFVLNSDGPTKSAVKMVKERALTTEEKDCFDFYHRLAINLPLLVALYPMELRRLVEHLSMASDEDLGYFIIEIFAIIALQGRVPNECKDLQQVLPSPRFVCEYSGLLKTVETAVGVSTTNLEKLSGHIDSSLSQFLVIGSASNTVAALLFEHVVWAEGGTVLVVFKRLRLKPALWFAMGIVSLFTSIVGNVDGAFMKLIDEKAKNSAEWLVWIGYILFRRLLKDLKKVMVDEDYGKLPQFLFYPLIQFEPQEQELMLMEQLNGKYGVLMRDMFSVMVPGKAGMK